MKASKSFFGSMLRNISGSIAVLLCVTAHADGVGEPIPSFYEEPGLSPNRKYINQHASEHIDPFSGKLQWHFTDLFIPGNGGFDLAVQRSYSSQGEQFPEYSPVGYGWTMHFGRVLRRAPTDICALGLDPRLNPVLELPDGGRHILYDALDGMSHISTSFWRAECSLEGGAGLIVHSPDGTRYEMTTPGQPLGSPDHPVNTYYATRITDRHGNAMEMTYQPVGPSFGVSAVNTSDGRSITFNYVGDSLAAVTDGVRTWGYTNVAGFLTEVTRPDGATWRFEYNPIGGEAGQASMTKATYPTGGEITYVYDFVTFSNAPNYPRSSVIKQKMADGGAWNYSYQPAQQALPGGDEVDRWTQFPDDKVDITTVTGPEGTRTYKHIGITSAPSGGVAHIGKQVISIFGNTQADATGFCLELISWQENRRPGERLVSDAHTYASILKGRNINRNGKNFLTTYEVGPFGNPFLVAEQGNARRETEVSYAVNTARWILHQKKDETIRADTGAGMELVGHVLRDIDERGNLLAENRFGVPTRYEYTAEGDVQSRTDARDNAVTYGSYRRGIPQAESHPEGVAISRTVSDAGNVLSETDGEGATTAWQYDGLNRPVSIVHARGNPIAIAWERNKRTLTRGDYREEVTYDAFGRDRQVVHTDTASGESLAIQNSFDILGRKVFASFPNNTRGTSYAYDIIGQLQQVGLAFNPVAGTAQAWRTYHLFGDEIQFQNERNFLYVQKYRGYGDPDKLELMSVEAPVAAASIAMKRNGLGQLLEVIQDGKTRTFTYDGRHFLTSQSDPETGVTSYGRDAVGNMTSRQVGAAPAVTFAYDGRNRLTATQYADGTSSLRSWYKDDKLATLANGVSSRSYAYDGNKNLTAESAVIGTQSFAIHYAYNGNDARESMTYGDGPTVSYGPDGFGRPTRATPYVTQVTHHPSGVISKMVHANGVETTIGLNARQWPSTLRIGKTGDLFKREHFYDGAGNIVAINDLAANRQMGYDALDRLVSATGPWAGTYQAQYDGRGNIRRQSWTASGTEYLARSYTYDDATERLQNMTELNGPVSTPYDFAYDASGNVTAKGATAFGYTDASTMRCAKCATPEETRYEYDGAHMRVRSERAGQSTYFFYGADGLLLWEQTPGASQKHYFYLGGKQIATHEKPVTP